MPVVRHAMLGVSVAIAALPTAAGAKITEYPRDPSATPLVRAMAAGGLDLRRGVFPALPPSSKPAAVSTTPLAGFPRRGKSFAILSTGNARYAARDNTSPSTGSESRGPSVRGARDVVIMRADVRVPRNHNCLSFDFRFLSEEFPEYVDDIYNDAFIAEIDVSDWDASSKADPTITAPRNFAQAANGNPIRVNAIGDTSVSEARSRGTTYDAATRLLRARTPVQPGVRRVYFSIFDQGDRIYDSAVFLDNLTTNRRQSCTRGARAIGE